MAASNTSGSNPKPVKSFSLDIGCDPEPGARAGDISTAMYDTILEQAGVGSTSLRQGRIVLSVKIYAPAGNPPTRGRAKSSAKKTSRGR